MIKEFAIFLKTKKLSDVSVKNYLSDVRRFLDWTAKNSYSKLTPAAFNAYKTTLEASKTSSRTINRYLSSLRCFGEFLQQEKLMMINPAHGLKNIESANIDSFNSTNENILQEFRQTLLKQNLKPVTIKNYMVDTKQFLSWLEASENKN